MKRRLLARIIVALLIATMLGGAYVIVAKSSGDARSQSEVPSGFLH